MTKFSVVIPTYNHAIFVVDAIESVLNQTCQDFEIIVVDDASTDNTGEVIKRINDSRLHYLVHKKNMGLSATRNTGIKAATGDFIAFLDADDWFHPQKLELHLDYLEKNPNVGVTYNARYELNHSSKTIRSIWRPPKQVGLSDFVVGFPFSPSDIVMRREWPQKVGLLDDNYKFYGEDLYFNCQLAMSGCRFGKVDRVLNYRRYYSGRQIKNIPEVVKVMLDVLNRVFDDPRCTAEVIALKDVAYAHYYLWYGVFALIQNYIPLGQLYMREAVRLRPSLLAGEYCELLDTLADYSVADDSEDHRLLLKKILDRLPNEFSRLSVHYEWGVARGYLIKGLRAAMWGRMEDGGGYINEAVARGVKLDQDFLKALGSQLLDYDAEFGKDATHAVIQELSPFIRQVSNAASVRWLKGCYWANRAINSYASFEYSHVPVDVLRALFYDLTYLTNRGILKIFLSSLAHLIKRLARARRNYSL